MASACGGRSSLYSRRKASKRACCCSRWLAAGRGPRYARRQSSAGRHCQCRREGSRVWRPSESDVAGHGRRDRRSTYRAGTRHQARKCDTRELRTCFENRRGSRAHDHHRGQGRQGGDRRTVSSSCARRLPTPRPTSTGRSSRNAWRNCQAASRLFVSERPQKRR
jgi:hypothetical protein